MTTDEEIIKEYQKGAPKGTFEEEYLYLMQKARLDEQERIKEDMITLGFLKEMVIREIYEWEEYWKKIKRFPWQHH